LTSTINASTVAGIVTTADTSGVLALQTAGTTAVTVDASQRVGIGTASPTQLLTLSSGATPRISLKDTRASVEMQVLVDNVAGYSGTVTSDPYIFVTNNAERMRIDSSGRLTTPYQPAFEIVGAGVLAVANNAVLPFSVAIVNVGSHFNTGTYTFTVPVTGIYLFAISVRWENTNSAATYWRLDLYINGLAISRNSGALAAVVVATYAYSSQAYVCSLTAGDTCKYHYSTSGAATNNIHMGESIFSGYLLG